MNIFKGRLTGKCLVHSFFSGLHAEIEERYFLLLRVLVDPPLISSVVINLIDENDQIPTFGIRSFQSSVLENEHGLRILARLRAFDRDIAEKNNLIRYKLNTDLSDNQTIQYFHVELNGTVWTNRIFRKEDNRTMYRLIITAYNEELVWNSSKQAAQDFQFDVQVIGESKTPPSMDSRISISEKKICLFRIRKSIIVDFNQRNNSERNNYSQYNNHRCRCEY